MSVASADINNDLRPAIYVGQITSFGKDTSKTREAGPRSATRSPTRSTRRAAWR